MFSSALKKGSIELLILSLLEHETRHGYELGKLIESRSGGRLRFEISSLYPVLAKMEDRRWIKGRWVEKEGERRRKFYRLTARGRSALQKQRQTWISYAAAVNQVVGLSQA